jgi:hypothetical protein
VQHSDHLDQSRSAQPMPADWWYLIRKLRWIGLEDEAKRLEFAIGTLRPKGAGPRRSDHAALTDAARANPPGC